jgi:predicted histone-like DNA-binding protein
MYAKYIKQEIPDLNGTGHTQAYYRMELTPMNHQEFVSLCAREGGYDESTILGVLSLVSDKLSLSMSEGYSVKLDGIGIFNAKLGMRDDVLQDAFEEGERTHNASSIMVKGVSYRADNDLIWNTSRRCILEKGSVSRLRKPKFTLEERIQKAKEFLTNNTIMRVPDYVRLTGLSRTSATQELRKLAANPSSGIASRGSRSQKFYILRPNP